MTLFSPRLADGRALNPTTARPDPMPVDAAGSQVTSSASYEPMSSAPGSDVPRAGVATEAAPSRGSSAPIAAPTGLDGYVVFRVGRTSFAVPVSEVREVVRAERIELLPDSGREVNGRALALVDARGRSIPVLDLRGLRTTPGDVLIPMWRHHVGVVVDRVLAVRSPAELVLETEDVPEALPSYSRGVLRPATGGAPVLLISMPDVPELVADAARVEEPRLGEDVLGVVADEDLVSAS